MSTALHWNPVKAPVATTLEGRFMRLEKLEPARHGDDLWELLHGPEADPKQWDFLPYGPFRDREMFDIWLDGYAVSPDPLGYCVVDTETGQAQGILSLMSIVPAHGRIEIGHVAFSSAMQRSPKGTEAIYQLAKFVFGSGYRRVEWKCDNANVRSRRAAERFGFAFEGVFRQHMVVKDQNRDTAWFSIRDTDWPTVEKAFEAWLDGSNFKQGQQIQTLENLRGNIAIKT